MTGPPAALNHPARGSAVGNLPQAGPVSPVRVPQQAVMKEHPELFSEQAPKEPGNREPVPIGDVIRAFRRHPERFIADTFPEPPGAA